MAKVSEELAFLEMKLTPENSTFIASVRGIIAIAALTDENGVTVIGCSTLHLAGLPRPLAVKGSPESWRDRLSRVGIQIITATGEVGANGAT